MEDVFQFYKQSPKAKNLILFVHGFTGGHNTWVNSNGISFGNLLLLDEDLKSNCDVASYEYYTRLFDIFSVSEHWYKRFFQRGDKKKKKNLDVSELANNLRDHLRFSATQYDNIFVIAHSMGGLITKSLIIDDINKHGTTKIKMFLSLAVPHLGAELAAPGKMISSNIQIENLSALSAIISNMNQAWVKLNDRPVVKYFYGSYDRYVLKNSAESIDVSDKDVISVAHDHLSISKPSGAEDLVVIATVDLIKECLTHCTIKDKGYQKLDNDELYNEELFVLKMIVADIHEDTQKNVKELFFNAEYVRKILQSRHDKEKLQKLFDNIRQLYRDSYDKYLGSEDKNSKQLLAEVHEKISKEDSQLLKSLIPTLQLFHKKGMLHQMANDPEYDIWWREDKTTNAS